MRVLFWNLGGRRDLSHDVAALVRTHRPDILGLCEADPAHWDGYALELVALGLLTAGEERKRFRMYVRADWRVREVQSRNDLYAIYVVEPAGVDPIVIGLAHFSSRLWTSVKKRERLASAMRSALREAEETELDQVSAQSDRVLAFGDFNADPWESVMTDLDGMRAIEDWDLPTRPVKSAPGERSSREVPAFYNPMWTRIGRRGSRPRGTYYFEDANTEGHHWHGYDSVLVRVGHIRKHGPPIVRILTRMPDGTSLLTPDGRPLGKELMSDHLPILAIVPL